MAPRVLIIQPAPYRSKADRRVVKLKSRRLVPLTLPYLGALTPRGWDVKLVDEVLEDVDLNADVDLVALTAWTVNSLRAYEIAASFRARGIPVVIGGPHAYFHADEVAANADAVAVGEAEVVWPQILADAAAGRLQRRYDAAQMSDLSNLPMPRYELLNLSRYGRIKTYAVQPSRGCPFKCDFCSERLFLGDGFRVRPVDDIIEEVKRCSSRLVFFATSNFAGKRAHAMELMEKLVPLKLRWSTLWTLHLCADPEFMDLAARSGLLHVNIGMESIDPATLRSMNKKQNKVAQYGEMLDGLRRRGISYSLNFIFGWEGESAGVFDATLEFLQRHKVPAAYFNILTPHVGSPFHARLLAEGRIQDPDEIGRYPGMECHITPPYCSPEELMQRIREMYRHFYSLPSIARRLPPPVTLANLTSWVINLSQRRLTRHPDQEDNFGDF